MGTVYTRMPHTLDSFLYWEPCAKNWIPQVEGFYQEMPESLRVLEGRLVQKPTDS